MMARIDLVVFDKVGTTVQDSAEAPDAFRAALGEFGVKVEGEHIHAVRGASKRDAIRALLGPGQDGRADAAYQRFTTLLAKRYSTHASPVDGVDELFALLRRQNIAIALNTGFDRATTDLLVDALGWSRATFAAIICADDVTNGRPAPDMIRAAMTAAGIADPARVMNVGDTRLDLEAGASAGVGFNVGVCSGAHGSHILAAAPHSHLIETVAELPILLCNRDATGRRSMVVAQQLTSIP